MRSVVSDSVVSNSVVSRRALHRLRSDDGSILPLTLGYAMLAIVTIFVCVCATSL